MNRDNVVPFETPRRSELARRGSPDKFRATIDRTIELECPRCAAVLCLDSKLPLPEVVCAACNSPLVSGEPETAEG